MWEIDLPPGIMRNGTDLQSEGRWRDGNLIRWRDGAMQPVGGWQQRNGNLGGIARASLAWSSNLGDRLMAFGTHDALKISTPNGAISDISPADLIPGNVAALDLVGYGIGPFGSGAYGTPRPEASISRPATTWSLDTWGENLIAVSTADQRILEWNFLGLAAPVANAPPCIAAVVSDERFVFALGADGDPRMVRWSDRENNTLWTPATTNEAGDYLLQTQGRIVTGIRAPGQVIVLTDIDAHAAQYIGPDYVYRFDRVGSACGISSARTLTAIEGGVFWMGRRSFFLYRGGSVSPIPCEVSDVVFENINVHQISLAHAVTNQLFNEVWVFYPSNESNECDRYVIWNYATGVWSVGELERTTGFDAGVFRFPIMADTAGSVHSHESGWLYGGLTPWAESGPIRQGAQVFTATQLIPDEVTQGQVTATFRTKFYPNGDEYSFGPYLMGEPTNVRFTGRQIRMRVDGAAPASWRVGKMRLQTQARGMR